MLINHGTYSDSDLVPYQSTGCKLEEQASNNGSEQLGNPVQNTPHESDVAAEEGTECDCGVNMTAGDVCSNGNRHEKCKAVRQGGGYKPGGCGCCIASELGCQNRKYKIKNTQTEKVDP